MKPFVLWESSPQSGVLRWAPDGPKATASGNGSHPVYQSRGTWRQKGVNLVTYAWPAISYKSLKTGWLQICSLGGQQRVRFGRPIRWRTCWRVAAWQACPCSAPGVARKAAAFRSQGKAARAGAARCHRRRPADSLCAGAQASLLAPGRAELGMSGAASLDALHTSSRSAPFRWPWSRKGHAG